MRKTEFFVILGHFLPFYHLTSNDPKNQNFEKKWKKYLEILSFYTYICTIKKDHMICFLKYKVRKTEIFVILGHFLPFQPHDNPKNQNFGKMKENTWIYHPFTYVYHTWQSYGSWDMKRDEQNFLSVWTFFAPLPL